MIRGYKKDDVPLSPNEHLLLPVPLESSATTEFTKNQQIEVTVSQHEMNVEQMGYTFRQQRRRKGSVYDYGANKDD